MQNNHIELKSLSENLQNIDIKALMDKLQVSLELENRETVFYVANEKDFFKNLNEDKFASDKSNITCEEFVMLVLNAMGYAPVTLGGANNYWMNAKEVGLFNDMELASISRDSIITRGFVADILYNALNAPMMERKIVDSTVIYEKTTNSLYEIRFQ